MPFSRFDSGSVAHYLAPMKEGDEDLAEAYFEELETVELPPDGEAPGLRLWRERGLAVRLARGDRSWMASRDRIDGEALEEACRLVARSRPRTRTARPSLPAAGADRSLAYDELDGFSRSIHRALRDRRVGFPLRLTVRSHHRDLQVVTPHIVPKPERERYYSVVAAMPWGQMGALFATLGSLPAAELAERLVESFRSREAAPVAVHCGPVVLGAAATAVFLHEVAAHALEADTLGQGGSPAAAIGTRLAGEVVDLIDDPGAAPEGLRRASDDEGHPVSSRWLLRRGVVEQPLADRRWALRYDGLEPGAGRRPHRHQPPGPRSSFLQLLPGDGELEDLVAAAGRGLYLPEADRGCLDPHRGTVMLHFPFGRRIRGGELSERIGPCAIRGSVAELLGSIARVGGSPRLAGAGGCAKSGGKLPVWASAPPILLAEARCDS